MKTSLLIDILRNPEKIKHFSVKDWNLLLRQANSAKMLSRLANSLDEYNLFSAIPEKIKNHINSEQVKVSHLHTQVNQEVAELNELFNTLKIKAIYLKGTAYLLANLPLIQGRFFSDIDILLNQSDITKVEIALKCQGWKSQKTNDHDQAYYRNYMHEIPPMQNILRGTIIDIHHNILPVCNNNKIDIGLLSKDAITITGTNFPDKPCQVLAPAAMFLHSAVHLFHEGELEQGLRGLSDLDVLFNHFNNNNIDFSQQLIDLAKEINQQHSLFYTWRFLRKVLHKDLPITAQKFVDEYPIKSWRLSCIDFIFTQLFNAHHCTTASFKFKVAAQMAYWRGHLLRMPMRLLIPHLLKKSWLQSIALFKKEAAETNTVEVLNPRFQPLDKD